MMKKTSALFSLTLLIILFVGLVIINNQLLSRYRVDLTHNQVYSLSKGSRAVLKELTEPVTLYFFFSDSATTGMTSLRNYADRVQSLLEEYEQAADGKIRLQIIDPEPFSEAEDQAAQFGLTGATVGSVGETIYFGLAGTNALDDQFTVPFFDPQKEQFLEYDVSKLIYQLSDPEPVKLALVTDMAVSGGQNPMTGEFSQPMVFYEQLSQLYDVEVVTSTASALPADTDVVVLAHPQNLSQPLQYAIDQFALNKGRIVAFVDPHHESDPMAMMGAMEANRSDLQLLQKWGVALAEGGVILDPKLGLDIRSQNGGIVNHPGILGLSAEELNREDVITANLEIINGASIGGIALTAGSKLNLEALATSSASASVLDAGRYAQITDPALLNRELNERNQQRVLAARLTGQARSAFDGPLENTDEAYTASTDALNLIMVADADLLTDRFWVQQSDFFGQTVYTPFANNGDFVINAVENLAGSNALISIRSRGTFARPFTRVKELELQAQNRFREQEERLQMQLAQTEEQLARLQDQQGGNGALVLTQEQQNAIDEFINQRIAIRKELRDVRYQLQRDIDNLGNWLKVINIAAAPLALVFLLFVLAKLLKKRAGKRLMENEA